MNKKGVNQIETLSIPVPGTKETLVNQGFSLVTENSRANSRAKKISLHEEFKQKILMLTPTQFKPAKLYSAGGDLSKEWYVEYYFQVPGELKYKRFKERFDMNRIPDLKDRVVFGREAAKFMNEKLQLGFNPFTYSNYKKGNAGLTVVQQLNLIVAELSAGETKNAIRTFNDRLNRFNTYLVEHLLHELTAGQIMYEHADNFKLWMIQKKLSVKTINETLSYITRYFNIALKKKWIPVNVFLQVDKLKNRRHRTDTGGKERFEPITSVEMDLIFKVLKAKGETTFIAYLALIYYAWLRPAEIRRLHIPDIDLRNDVIRLRKNDTKNNSAAFVQIVPPLKLLLQRLQLDHEHFSSLIFGRDQLKPGKQDHAKNYCINKWKAIVKDELGIDKDMYALKHTGNIDYLLNNKGNTDLKWQQSQNRHKTSAMTDRYNRKLGAYFIEVGDLNFKIFE